MPDSWKQFLDKPGRPANDGPPPRLPYELDEVHDSRESGPRDDMLQAYRDLMNGLVDTDLHGYRGVEEVVKQNRAAEQTPAQISPSQTPSAKSDSAQDG